MDFIIFDLEATCWEGNTLGREQEIIEIGALRMNAFGEVGSTFQRFVRPVMHPRLSVYCKRLTGITQDEVDSADTFDRVLGHFHDWYDQDGDILLCSWGAKDHQLLEGDMALHRIEDGLPDYIELKEQYYAIKDMHKKMGLKRVLDREGFDFEGTHHRALDDATNLSYLFR